MRFNQRNHFKKSVLFLILYVFLLFAFLFSCTSAPQTDNNSETDNDIEDDITPDETAPTGTVSPIDGLILSTISIVATFDEEMDPESLNLGGNMAAESDSGVWSSNSNENDTLTISPISKWTCGTDRTLIIDVKDLAGNSLATISLSYEIIEKIIYVSTPANGGDDGNSGTTQDQPVATITNAIAQIIGSTPAIVMVSEGTYSETNVSLVDELTLLGGYSASDWDIRDPEVHTTTLQDTGTSGNSETNPNHMLYADGSVTGSTLIEGFTINGSSGGLGAHFTSIFLDGGSPTIRNCILNGGDTGPNGRFYGVIISNTASPVLENNSISGGGGGTGSKGYGVRIDNSSPIIRGNEIDCGTALGDKTAIYCTSGSSPVIDGNTITAGLYGIYNNASSAVIRNNVIIADGAGYAIQETASSSLIQNNTLRGGNRGIHIESTSNPTIENNIIFLTSTTYCIFEADADAQPASVRNNNLFYHLFGYSLYRDFELGSKLSIHNQITTQEGTGWMDTDWNNVKIEPVFVDKENLDWHLTELSPSEVTEGGMDLSESFTTDKDGNTRTEPWSMGAYEYDQGQ